MTDERIAILLCTYNGEKFLAAQLASIERQAHRDWCVWASDDGSTDNTAAILARTRDGWGGDDRLTVVQGPKSGFIANFLSLACNPAIDAPYYAYADQDDVWEPEKFTRALAWHKTQPPHVPALYCARTALMDEAGNATGFSPLFVRKPPSFRNALVQSIAGGNTMVFNRAARALLMDAGPMVRPISHDWFTYQLVTGCGGTVFYDTTPSIRYRQHGNQVFGSNVGLLPRLQRAVLVAGGRFKVWTDTNTKALVTMRHRFTPENQRIYDLLQAARTGSLEHRLVALRKSGVHRQGWLDNVGLYTTVLLNRL
jgi:glycosyltransferase involved in cell wall biosynthesis